MEIEIKDRNGKGILKFYDFKFRSLIKEFDQIFVSFKLALLINLNISKFELDAELSDFEEMLNHLEVLNEDLKRVFYFKHSDSRIEIKFTPNVLGTIELKALSPKRILNLKRNSILRRTSHFLTGS